jgi:thymidylate synthase (FAD)
MTDMHDEVKLAGYSRRIGAQPDETLGDQIAYYARVSNPTSAEMGKGNDKLIGHLIRHKHWSPFEMVSATMKITSTRDIVRQILRHKSFSFQEFSQRYSATETTGAVREAQLQDYTDRQNSLPNADKELTDWWEGKQMAVMGSAFEIYDQALKRGIAKEQARAILPEGLTRSTIFMSGSIRSWLHYCELRTGPETQKEHREIAAACAVQIARVFPQIIGVLQHD